MRWNGKSEFSFGEYGKKLTTGKKIESTLTGSVEYLIVNIQIGRRRSSAAAAAATLYHRRAPLPPELAKLAIRLHRVTLLIIFDYLCDMQRTAKHLVYSLTLLLLLLRKIKIHHRVFFSFRVIIDRKIKLSQLLIKLRQLFFRRSLIIANRMPLSSFS